MLLSIGTVAILARILTPEDYGIIGVGAVLMALFTGIQDFGILPSVVQRDTRIEDSISVGITLRVIIAGLILGGVVAASPLLSDFFTNPAIPLVVMVMCVNLFVAVAGFPSQVVITRSLRFSNLAIAGSLQAIATSSVSITLAILGFSYWSVVFGSIFGTIVLVACLIRFQKASLRPKVEVPLMKDLLGFGSHLLLISLMGFVIFGIDQIIVARVLGVAVLGVYFVAAKLGRTFGEQMATAVSKVLFPTMSRMKDDLGRLRASSIQTIRMISILAVPTSLGLSALSPLFVRFVLGESWVEAIVPVAIISFQGLAQSLILPIAHVIYSVGKPRYISIQAVIQGLLIVTLTYPVAVAFGINGVCLLTTLLSLAVLVYSIVIMAMILRTKLTEIVRPLIPSYVSGIVMFAILFVLCAVLPGGILTLVFLAALGLALYMIMLHILSKGRDIRDFFTLVRGLLPGRSRS
jgi:O-antigen/teichoic acid export membrane protein